MHVEEVLLRKPIEQGKLFNLHDFEQLEKERFYLLVLDERQLLEVATVPDVAFHDSSRVKL